MSTSMGSFQVTPEYVSNAAASCQSTAQEIQDQLGALKNYIVQMEDAWQGIAANTFQELMAQYNTYSTMLHNALTDIGQGLQGNYVNYAAEEHANITTIQSIATSLEGTNFT
jgi:WXG100 family type VII secretion target